MIQRIQTLYLALSGVCFIVVVLFRSAYAQESLPWLVWVILGLNVAAGLDAVAAIFLYKDRKKQLTIVSLLQYVALVAILASFVGLYLSGAISEVPANVGALGALALPVAGYVLIRMAVARIRKDIELVRSMDRLR